MIITVKVGSMPTIRATAMLEEADIFHKNIVISSNLIAVIICRYSTMGGATAL